MVSSRPYTVTSKFTVQANESDTNSSNDAATLSVMFGQGLRRTRRSRTAARPEPAPDSRQAKGLTAIVVDFDQPMNPARLQNLGIYHL